ncbi:right-handed parallel beta-helix repeat-containing protein [Sphingomonas morindae]|uniref:Right-handed parallel beta-helix repeat-containing protein n=1 Tax=Sphingomonas morindae TaxID=1541170 RepID=A0ABY4X3X2_9SPHN|nr:right-handed parallel beta-helix repeat-containing protein [Sphingomonas morindae]USI71607.1 right-handed parallel beta-helix repeat-containing protein [Sphingomonas morindae]
MLRILLGAVSLACALFATPAAARTIYVSPGGNDTNNCLSTGQACRTIRQAVYRTQPGDQVLIAKGDYVGPTWIGRGGAEGKPVVYNFAAGARLVHDPADDKSLFTLDVAAPYVRILNGEFVGTLQSITLDQAQANYRAEKATGKAPTHQRFNQYCIAIHADHVQVASTYVHDCSGAGIYAQNVDDVEIAGNRVERTCWWTLQDPSAIDFHYGRTPLDGKPKGVRILNNTVRDTANLVPFWMDPLGAKPTDGNGIIVDLAQGHDAAYAGTVLIQGNTVERSGGSGIRAYGSKLVTMAKNIVTGSHTCPIDGASCGDENGELNFNASTGAVNGNTASITGGRRALFVYKSQVLQGANTLNGVVDVRP